MSIYLSILHRILPSTLFQYLSFCLFGLIQNKKYASFSQKRIIKHTNLFRLLIQTKKLIQKNILSTNFFQHMPRDILFPQEQENQTQKLGLPNKEPQKRSSKGSNFSDEDPFFESKWRTNLMIPQDHEKVQRRDQGYRKNTSFENKIINDHIKVMAQCVCEIEETSFLTKCSAVCRQLSSKQSSAKEGINCEKVQDLVQGNLYLTQDQKIDMTKLFTQNYDNYQILLKVIQRLECLKLLKDEVKFILFKVVEYISNNYELRLRRYDESFMEEQIPKRLVEIVNFITCHPNVQLINPEYFYNCNEKKYMKIIEVWFYCIFAIKLGVYGNKYLRQQEESMMMNLEM